MALSPQCLNIMKKAKIKVHKKGNRYIVTDICTDVQLYSTQNIPMYSVFSLGKAIQSGIGSVMNVPGNFYSFRNFQSVTDEQALESDWKNVGIALLDAFSSIK
mgnify:CR=1 FL=1